MEYIRSPFAGSRVKIPVKNRITQKTFDENPRYKEEFVYDPEKGDCDFNDHFEQWVHKDREEYLLIRKK
jgi:hypothetical protein